MDNEEKTKYLCQFLTKQRLRLIDEKLMFRTRHITLVLEDIFQSQNGAACLRSAEAFGIQDIHVIENRNQFSIHKDVLRGASKWLTIHRYHEEENNTVQCLSALTQKGYQLVATTPHVPHFTDEILTGNKQTESSDSLTVPVPLHAFDVTPKTALMFGTEKTGLTQEAMTMAETFLTIPITGFTESLNLSASAAICLYTLTHKLKQKQSTLNSALSNKEIVQLRGEWIRKSLGYRLEKLEREYDRRNVCSENSE